MADLLGSDQRCHNWARGVAVAAGDQHKIHDLINGGGVPAAARPVAGLLQGGNGGNNASGKPLLPSTADRQRVDPAGRGPIG
ncbi:MAG: hypothetical protein KIT58_03480 [Planctomycetota bacterium]|nr:hypothetical protein [Planctomycetota bacterium]